MSNIPPELLAEMMPGVRAFVESLVTQTAEMQAQNGELEGSGQEADTNEFFRALLDSGFAG